MTTHTVIRDRTVLGTVAQLANVVANHRDAGTLVAITAPRPLTDGRFQMTVRLREHVPVRPTRRVTSVGQYAHTRTQRPRHTRVTRIAVIATVAVGVTASLVAGVAYLLDQLVEFVSAYAAPIVGVLALVVILAGLRARRSSSGRRHCPGC